MNDTELLNWLESQMQKSLGGGLWYEAACDVHLGKPLREALAEVIAEEKKTLNLSHLARQIYNLIRDSKGGYLAVWTIAEMLDITLPANHCGCREWTESDTAMKELVDGGLIEELPDLHCRYRVKV